MPNWQALSRSIYYIYIWVIVAYLSWVMYPNFPLFLAEAGYIPNAAFFDVVLLCIATPLIITTSNQWLPFLKHRYAIWCFALFALLLLNYWRLSEIDLVISLEELIDQENRYQRMVLMITYAYLVYVIGTDKFTLCLIPITVVIPSLIVLDFVMPGLMDTVGPSGESGRAQGTFINANIASEACIATIVLTHRRISPKWLMLILVVVGAGVVVTFSRSGMAAWMLVCGLFLLRRSIPRWFALAPILVGVFYSTFLVFAEQILSSFIQNPSRVENMLARLNFLDNVVSDGINDSSGEARTQIAHDIFLGVLEKPLLGHTRIPMENYGVASHNLSLEYWSTFGIVGLLLVLTMAWLLHARSVGSRSVLGFFSPEMIIFLWFSFFNHSLFQSNFWFLFYALVLMNTVGISRYHFAAGRPKQASSSRSHSDGSSRRRRRKKRHV